MEGLESEVGTITCALDVQNHCILPHRVVIAGTSQGALLAWSAPTLSQTSMAVSDWPLRVASCVHALAIRSIAVSNQYLATAGDDATIFVDQTNSLLFHNKDLDQEEGGASAVASSSSSSNKKLTNNDALSNFPRRIHTGHTLPITHVEWAPWSATQLLSLSYDGSLRMFDVVSGSCTLRLSLNAPLLHGVFGPDDTIFFVGGDEGFVAAVDMCAGVRVQTQRQRIKVWSPSPVAQSLELNASEPALHEAITVLEWGAKAVADREDLSSSQAHVSPFSSVSHSSSTAAKSVATNDAAEVVPSEVEMLLRRGRRASAAYDVTLSICSGDTEVEDGEAAAAAVSFPQYLTVRFDSEETSLSAAMENSGSSTRVSHTAKWGLLSTRPRWHIAVSADEQKSSTPLPPPSVESRDGRSSLSVVSSQCPSTIRSVVAQCLLHSSDAAMTQKKKHTNNNKSNTNSNNGTSLSSIVLGMRSWTPVTLPRTTTQSEDSAAVVSKAVSEAIWSLLSETEKQQASSAATGGSSPGAGEIESSSSKKRKRSAADEVAASTAAAVPKKLTLMEEARVEQATARAERAAESAAKRQTEMDNLKRQLAEQQATCDLLMEKLRAVAKK